MSEAIVIQALKKENAELKEKYAKECEDVCYVVTNYNKQLTKAKEIIRQLMYASRDCIAWYCLCDKARQFLKEIEK